ncbi:MAG: hypothetical protein WC188_10225, partial [Candidatus Caldatribacteriota bacterium]
MINFVIDALKAALREEAYNKEVTDEKAFFMLLKENGLFGVIGPYLDDKLFSKRFIELKNATIYEYIKKDQAQQALIKKVDDLLNTSNIKHIFLKGSRLKP